MLGRRTQAGRIVLAVGCGALGAFANVAGSAPARAEQPTLESLSAWQKVAVKEDLVGDGRHHSVTTLRNRVAKIADGQIVVEAEQVMMIPPEDPVPSVPAGITRAGSVRVTATAKITDLDLHHIDVSTNSDLPVEDRIRGSGRGRYIVIPCLNDTNCWQLTSVQTSDTAPGEASNHHEEKPFVETTRANLPTFWADASSAEQAKDVLVAGLQKAMASTQ
jgi:hypothetical protein